MNSGEGEPRGIERRETRYVPEASDALREAAEALKITINEAENLAALALRDLVRAGMGTDTAVEITDRRTGDIVGEIIVDLSAEDRDLLANPNIIPFRSRI